MSRSFCKPVREFHIAYRNEIEELKRDTYYDYIFWGTPSRWFDTWDELNKAKWKYYTKKHTCHRHSYRFPKSYRKMINSQRKNKDKRELFKEINFIYYEGLYDPWNCKTADPYWFW